MFLLFLILFSLVSIILIILIIFFQGKESENNAILGLNSTKNFFNNPGTGNFITRLTSFFAALFFIFSLILGNLTIKQNKTEKKWENIGTELNIKKKNFDNK
ncbi:MAG: preprotein translocase subunit SecG [Arsenophonus sp.]|nr:MAG: preprotein translocase subunit SecG [Arsenophonus sp.]